MYQSLFIIWLSHFLMDFMLGIWPVFKTLAGLDIAKAGLIAGLSMFGGEAVQLWFGYLSDKGWRRKLAIAGILMAGSVALFAYTQNYLVLFILVFFLYLGSSAFHPAAIGLVGDWFKEKNGLFITLFFSGGTLGAALSQILFTRCYIHFHGHTWMLMIPIVLMSLWLMAKPFPAQDRMESNFKTMLTALKPFHSVLRRLFSILLCAQAIILSMMFLLPDLLQGRYEEWFIYGGAYAFFVLGAAILSIPAGYMTDRFGEKNVMISISIIGCAAFYSFLTIPSMPLPLAAIFMFLIGGMLGAFNPIIVASCSRQVPKNVGSFTAGLLMGVTACLSGIILIGISLLANTLGESGIVLALEICGILFFVKLCLLAQKPIVFIPLPKQF